MSPSGGFLDSLQQQKLPSHHCTFGPIFVFSLTFFLGILCVGIGIALTDASNRIEEFHFDYTNQASDIVEIVANLTGFNGNVYVYYQLEGIPQLHHSMRHSYDFEHFAKGDYSYICTGEMDKDRKVRNFINKLHNDSLYFIIVDALTPKSRDQNNSVPIPCGERARFFFNDDVEIYDSNKTRIDQFSNKNITWPEQKVYFQNSKNFSSTNPCSSSCFQNSTSGERYKKPDKWTKHICEMENAMANEDFIVWMVPAYAKTFRKLWKQLIIKDHQGSNFKDGLPNGNYTIKIKNNWHRRTPTDRDGNYVFKKSIIISTANWAGGKSNILGIAYLFVGVIILLFGCGLTIMQSLKPTYLLYKKQEQIRWRKNE